MSANDGFNGGSGRPYDPQQSEHDNSKWGAGQWQDDQAASAPDNNSGFVPPQPSESSGEAASTEMPLLPDLNTFATGSTSAGHDDTAEEDAPKDDLAASDEPSEHTEQPDQADASETFNLNFGGAGEDNATRAYDTQAFQSDSFATDAEQQDAGPSDAWSVSDQPTEVFQRDEFGGAQSFGTQSYGAGESGHPYTSQPDSSQPDNQDGPEFTQSEFTQQPYGATPEQQAGDQQPYEQFNSQQSGDYQPGPYLPVGGAAPFQNAGPVPMSFDNESELREETPTGKKKRRRKSKSQPADFAAAGAPGAKKKKRRTGWIVAIAVVAVLAIAAAVLVPLYLHMQNQQRGDQLAQEFNEKVKAYEESWNNDALVAASGPEDFAKIVGSKRESVFIMSGEQKKQFEAVCGDVQAARDARQKLADTKVPELPKDEAARASEAYKKAEKKSADLSGTERARATEFLDESDDLLNSMESLCNNLGPYSDAEQTKSDRNKNDLPKTITVQSGDSIVSDDGKVEWKCTAPEGCRDLYHKDTRTKYADVIDSVYTDYYNTVADLLEKQCFADDFASVCSESVEPHREAAKKSKAYTDYLRKTEPVAETGKPMFPDGEKLLKEASDAQYAAEEAFVNAWRAMDGDNPPSSMASTASSLGAYYQAKQDKVRELADAVGGDGN